MFARLMHANCTPVVSLTVGMHQIRADWPVAGRRFFLHRERIASLVRNRTETGLIQS